MNSSLSGRLALSVSIGFALSAVFACGEEPLSPNGEPSGLAGTAGLAGSAGASGSAASSGTGGSTGTGGSGGAGPVISVPDASPDANPDAPLNEDAACGTGSANAMLSPVNMLVMFDRSGSMNDEADEQSQATRWDLASAALSQFFQEPGAASLGVALRFFPHDLPSPGCSSEGCEEDEENGNDDFPTAIAACSEVLVDMAPLLAEPAPADAHEAALVEAVSLSAPEERMSGGGGGGGTPIYAALAGALSWAADHQLANPDQKTVVIFVTDGEPNGCDEDFDNIAALAEQAYATTGVPTYAIGLTGASEDQMNQLAEAGGTNESFFISDGATASADLLAALNAIRGMTLSCDFPMPTATNAGMPINPEQLNVKYTASATGVETTFSKVPSAADCATSASWYYDNETNPTRIYLCPAACELVQADDDAALDILVGCLTIVEPPR